MGIGRDPGHQHPRATVNGCAARGPRDHDFLYGSWPGHGLPKRAQHGSAELRAALLAEVKTCTAHATEPEALADLDLVTFTRGKVEPMVCGLFKAADQQPVLDMLARSVVFLTRRPSSRC